MSFHRKLLSTTSNLSPFSPSRFPGGILFLPLLSTGDPPLKGKSASSWWTNDGHSGGFILPRSLGPHTHIVLIPKKNQLEYITEYLLISLGNVVSRIISKVLANQIKPILPNVIFDSQSAFMPNRLITDNTTVAFEMLHHMRNKRKESTN